MSVIPQTSRASGGLRPLSGLCPGPARDLQRSPDPSPTHPPPPNHKSWIRPRQWPLAIRQYTQKRFQIEHLNYWKLIRQYNIFQVYLGVNTYNIVDLFDLLCLTPLSAIFQLYHGDSISGGRSRSPRREPPTMGKQLV